MAKEASNDDPCECDGLRGTEARLWGQGRYSILVNVEIH